MNICRARQNPRRARRCNYVNEQI